MAGLFKEYGFYLIAILVGLLLYGIGNLFWGKKQHGGKRLVLLLFGLGALGLGGLLIVGSVLFWRDGTSRIFVCLLFGGAVAMAVFGVYAAWLSFSADGMKIEKTFDSLLGGL